MFRLLRFLVADRRRAQLQRLTTLAARMDEVLMTSSLKPETRQKLEGKREGLEERIREMISAGTVVA